MNSRNEPTAEVLIFFQLDMQLPALRNIFTGIEHFSDLLGGKRAPQIAPGVTIGPPSMPISKYKGVKINYVGARYLLQQNGPLTELLEANEILPSLFGKQGYSLDELVRFCEFDIPYTPLVGKGVVDWIRSNVKVDLKSLSKVCNEDIKPFAFWISNSDTPLTDDWFNIILQPDINSPHNRLIWRLVKRARTHSELSEFLKRVKPIIDELGRMFGAQ